MSVQPLRIVDLQQSYGTDSLVLAGVSLEVVAGDAIALVGMNGAGKTSLIKAILDFITVDSGIIEIYGTSQTDYRARRQLSFLPEHFKPPYYLKGIEFLDMMSSLYRAEHAHAEIAYYSRSLGLDPAALAKPVRQYSKGMAQKLGLVACLASGRDLLVLDEPMSGLDPKARHQFKQVLREKRERGMTLLFSTHLLADVGDICNRMAILHEGKIRFCGTPDECCRQFNADDIESAYMNCIGFERDQSAC